MYTYVNIGYNFLRNFYNFKIKNCKTIINQTFALQPIQFKFFIFSGHRTLTKNIFKTKNIGLDYVVPYS